MSRDREPVIEALGARDLDHLRRQVDAGEPVDMRAERRAGESGAAAEIEHAAEARAVLASIAVAQQRRRRVGQVLQRAVEARRVLVEQRAHVSLQRAGRRIGAAEPREMQRRAVAVLRVGSRARANAARAPSRSPSASRASPSANQAEAKPGASSTACA